MAEFCYRCTQDHFGDGNKNDLWNCGDTRITK